MARPKLNLHSRENSDKRYGIFLAYSFNKQRLRYYTGVSIEKKYFQPNFNSGKARPIKSTAPYAEQLNNKLEDMVSSVITIVSSARGDQLNVEYVRVELDKIFKPKTKVTEHLNTNDDFISFFDKIIEDSKEGKRLIVSGPNKGTRYSIRAIKNYNNTILAIKRCMDYKSIKKLEFSDINESFYNDFRSFCYDVEEKEISTFSSYIKDIKTIMGESPYKEFNNKAFHKPGSESDTLALTLDQVDTIHNLDLSDSTKFISILVQKNKYSLKIYYPTLDKVRDLFLIGCYSALRFQNYTELTIDTIENGFIRVIQKKTGKPVTIPIMKRMQLVLDKYNGGLPGSISNQQFNKLIKEVAKLAGLTQMTKVKVTKGNKVSYENVPLYERISSHTARRTYATIMFKAGVPPLLIMSATGHSTEKSFLKYIRATNEDKSRLLAEAIEKLGL